MQSCGWWSHESQLVGWHWQAWNAPPLLWCHCICHAWWLYKKMLSSSLRIKENISYTTFATTIASAMTELERRSSLQPITTDCRQARCAFRLPAAGTLYTTKKKKNNLIFQFEPSGSKIVITAFSIKISSSATAVPQTINVLRHKVASVQIISTKWLN